jgi:hypothetical protein
MQRDMEHMVIQDCCHAGTINTVRPSERCHNRYTTILVSIKKPSKKFPLVSTEAQKTAHSEEKSDERSKKFIFIVAYLSRLSKDEKRAQKTKNPTTVAETNPIHFSSQKEKNQACPEQVSWQAQLVFFFTLLFFFGC